MNFVGEKGGRRGKETRFSVCTTRLRRRGTLEMKAAVKKHFKNKKELYESCGPD